MENSWINFGEVCIQNFHGCYVNENLRVNSDYLEKETNFPLNDRKTFHVPLITCTKQTGFD
jgi:hypothetical protein